MDVMDSMGKLDGMVRLSLFWPEKMLSIQVQVVCEFKTFGNSGSTNYEQSI